MSWVGTTVFRSYVGKPPCRELRCFADNGGDRPSWMGTVDFGGLKMKLIASIVAISAIHLLKQFMEIGKSSKPLDEAALYWLVVIHMVFVGSGVLMAAADWLGAKSKKG